MHSLLKPHSFYHVECVRSGEKHASIHVILPCAMVIVPRRTVLGLGFGIKINSCMCDD
jgi:hypothetical protein